MTLEQIVALVIGIGSMPILSKILDVWRAHKNGRAREEKQQNRLALGRLVAAENRADNEATYRRKLEEYASGLRRLLIDWGYPEHKLPSWPAKEKVQ